MIMFGTAFWIMVGFFAVIGTQRTWTREVIATTGLVLSLFIIYMFMPILFDFLGFYNQSFEQVVDTTWKITIVIMSSIHLFIAFIAYAGPAISGRMGAKLKVRDNVQDKLMAALVGAVNGYLVVGALWGFMNYYTTKERVWLPTAPYQYPFAPYLTRPTPPEWDTLMQWLPIPLLVSQEYLLPVLLAALVLFVLIVMI